MGDMMSVEVVVNVVLNVLWGLYCMVNGGNGMRRGLSEEGWIKFWVDGFVEDCLDSDLRIMRIMIY